MEISHEYFKENILPHFSDLFSYRTPVLPYREPELIDGFKHVPEVLKKHHISHILLCHRSGGLQTRAYKTFGKTAFKI